MMLYNESWPLSTGFCAAWLMLDVLFSSSSILHLCMLSFERYIALSRPFTSREVAKYKISEIWVSSRRDYKKKIRKETLLKISVVWMMAFAISIPIPIIGIRHPSYILKQDYCAIYISEFAVVGSIVAFFLPLIIMTVIHYLTIRSLQKEIKKASERFSLMPVATWEVYKSSSVTIKNFPERNQVVVT